VELIWDGESDSGQRGLELVDELQFRQHPEGVSVSLRASHAFVEIPTRSYWALATWTVSALMIAFGLAENWILLALAPFMIAAAIMQSLGRVSILIKDERVRIFEGAGGIGRHIELPLRGIHRVEYAVKRGRGGSTSWIVLNDAKFGRHLNEEQIRFVIGLLLDATGSLAA
jgi:hypothetical protein